MGLVLALKNRHQVVVAADHDPAADDSAFSPLMVLPSHCVLLTAGNLEAARPLVVDGLMPRLHKDSSAAAVAQLLHAALVLRAVPTLPQLKGRIEFIVAGIDPVRHILEPGLYYLDSASQFNLQLVRADVAFAGATAAVSQHLDGRTFPDASVSQLKAIAKECLTATKLRWPGAVNNSIRIGVITEDSTQVEEL